MSYASFILRYFGYINQSAILFKSLCKDSRNLWNQNIKAITFVVLNGKQWRLRIKFNQCFRRNDAEYLIENQMWLLFTIELFWSTKINLKDFEYLLDNAGDIPSLRELLTLYSIWILNQRPFKISFLCISQSEHLCK